MGWQVMKKLTTWLLIFLLVSFLSIFSMPNISANESGESYAFDLTIIHGEGNVLKPELPNLPHGTQLEIDLTGIEIPGKNFVFYIIDNQIVRDQMQKFTVTSHAKVTAVFAAEDEIVAVFMDTNGEYISADYVTTGEVPTAPDVSGLSKPGYNPVPFGDLGAIDDHKIFVVSYEPSSETTILVNGVEYPYNSIVTLESDNPDFTHWEENGVVVSYNREYKFSAIYNRTIEEKTDGIKQTLITLTNGLTLRPDDLVSFLGQFELMDEEVFIEAGILGSYTFEETLTLDTPGVEVIVSNSIHPLTNEFIRTINNSEFVVVRGYLRTNLGTYYSDNQVVNDNFDTALVSDEAEFKAALENTNVRFIEFLDDISVEEITSENKLLLTRSDVSINGAGYTLNLPTVEGWSSAYFQIWNAQNVKLENLTISGGDAALFINLSDVTLTDVLLEGQEFGGIEVKGTESHSASVTFDGVTYNISEALPIVWVDDVTLDHITFSGLEALYMYVPADKAQIWFLENEPTEVAATNGSVSYGSIQTAIDYAKDFDTIVVAKGTHYGQLYIDKPLTLTDSGTHESIIRMHAEDEGEDGYYRLISVVSDDVTISNLYLLDEKSVVFGDYQVAAIHTVGNNISVLNNLIDGFNRIQIHINSYENDDVKWVPKTGILVEGNTLKNARDYSAIYLQGTAGDVLNNTIIDADFRGIQIQPYSNTASGRVADNEISAGKSGLYYNTANAVAGSWTFENNTVTAADLENSEEWHGISIEGFNASNKVTFINNSVDGALANRNESILTIGIRSTTSLTTSAILTNNTLINVDLDTVDSHTKIVTNKTQLESALANQNITHIYINGTIGSEASYTIYTLDRHNVTIKGLNEAKVYGTFIIKANGVTVEDLSIQNQGNLTVDGSTPSNPLRSAIYVWSNSITLRNNIFTNGLGDQPGLSNAVQVMASEDVDLDVFVIESNQFIGHDNEVPNWSSSGLVFVQGYNSGTLGGAYGHSIEGNKSDYDHILLSNTFTNNAHDLAHQDWSSGLKVLYPFVAVNETQNEGYHSIQEALNDAADGDTITLTNGTYTEELKINTSVTLTGSGTHES